jgi:mannose/cellobiose epimerase-like protein (N-acyl-D-glucosamine 2-epimerase family)
MTAPATPSRKGAKLSTLRYFLIILGLLALSSTARGQFRSSLLNDPDAIVDWVDTNARFWFSAYDDQRGGFYTNVARDGSLIAAWGRNKDVLTQSRDAYAMVRAFQMTGDEEYLDYAHGALDFMYANGWDTTYGGWLNKLGETGEPLNPNESKTAFYQHYALLGPMAMVEATDSETDWEWLIRGYEYNEDVLWDKRENFFGYYDVVTRSGVNPTRKSFNATVDAVTTHALQLYLRTGEPKYLTRLKELADNMLNRLAASMDAQQIGFAEKYNSNWDVMTSERLTIMGHVLKTAWCFARINEIAPDPDYVAAAERLANHVLDNGYDHEFGAPYKDYDRTTGEMMLWGIPDSAKAWWQVEQAVMAGLELYRTTGDPKYLEMADESLDFFRTYFQDPVYGEVYADVTRYGGPIPQWGDNKGNDGKAGYHSIETGYYTYLYSKLFLKDDVATLHYHFDAAQEDRNLTLTPIAAKPGVISIAAVRLDGMDYDEFNSFSRELRIPAGIEGHFEVDFVASSALATETYETFDLSLGQNFPNPFRDGTSIVVTSPVRQHITLRLYDVAGRAVRTIVDGTLNPGQTILRVDRAGLSNGVYIYRLVSGSGTMTKKMLLVD